MREIKIASLRLALLCRTLGTWGAPPDFLRLVNPYSLLIRGQILTPGLSDLPSALLGSFFASRSLAHYGMMVPFGHYLMLFAEQMAVSLLLEFSPTSLRQKQRKTDFMKSIVLTFFASRSLAHYWKATFKAMCRAVSLLLEIPLLAIIHNTWNFVSKTDFMNLRLKIWHLFNPNFVNSI